MKTYIGHTNRTYSVFCDFTHDGQYVVSGSEDSKVFLWHLQNRQIVQMLEGHRGMFLNVYLIRSAHVGIDAVIAVAVCSPSKESLMILTVIRLGQPETANDCFCVCGKRLDHPRLGR